MYKVYQFTIFRNFGTDTTLEHDQAAKYDDGQGLDGTAPLKKVA